MSAKTPPLSCEGCEGLTIVCELKPRVKLTAAVVLRLAHRYGFALVEGKLLCKSCREKVTNEQP